MALKNEIKGILLELITVGVYLVLIFIAAIIIMR